VLTRSVNNAFIPKEVQAQWNAEGSTSLDIEVHSPIIVYGGDRSGNRIAMAQDGYYNGLGKLDNPLRATLVV